MDNNSFVKTFIFILLIVSLLAGSCAPKSRTITPLSKSDKSSIKKVAINVQVNEELIAVSGGVFHCEGAACMLAVPVLFGLILIEGPAMLLTAIIVDQTIGKQTRNEKAEELREDVSDINMDKLTAESIDEYFESTDAPFEAEISEINSPAILAQQGFDTLLDITIDKLDIKPCPRRVVLGYDDDLEPIYREDQIRGGTGPLSSDDVDYKDAIARWNAIYSDYFWKTNKPAKHFLYSVDATRVSKEEADELNRLEEEVEKLRPVVQEYISDSVRTWITFKGKIISTRDGRVLWDREELYYDPKCERYAKQS